MGARRYGLQQLLAAAALIGATFALSLPARGQTQPTTAPSADAAVRRGLEFLAKKQNPDGSFDAGENKVAVTENEKRDRSN